jgi:hypothetical protein
LIYKEHEEFNFSPKRLACRQTGEANIYKKCPQSGIISGVEPTKDRLEACPTRFLLLKADPLIKECGIHVRKPENISRFLCSFSFKTTQMLRDINFRTFKKLLKKKKLETK